MVWVFGYSRETGTTGPIGIRSSDKRHMLCEPAHFSLMVKLSIATSMACLISTCCVTAGMIQRSFYMHSISSGLMAATCAASESKIAKPLLVKLLRRSDYGIFLNEHVEDEAAVVFQHACKLGLEGIVSKRRGSPYVSGRSPHWLKLKNSNSAAVKREAEEEWG
jgi:hypothetical protein